jgi:hypothetical protein
MVYSFGNVLNLLATMNVNYNIQWYFSPERISQQLLELF